MPFYQDLDRSKAMSLSAKSILAPTETPEPDLFAGQEPEPDLFAGQTPDVTPAGAVPGGTQPDSAEQDNAFIIFVKNLSADLDTANQAIGDITKPVFKGLTLGAGLPIEAWIKTIIETGPGHVTDFGDRYKKQHQKVAQEYADIAARSPVKSLLGEIGGGLATGTGVSNLIAKGVSLIPGLPNLARLGLNLTGNVGQAALSSGMGAPVSIFEKPEAVGKAAEMGALYGGAMIPAGFAAGKIAQKAVDYVSPEVARRLLKLSPKQKVLYEKTIKNPENYEMAKQVTTEYQDDIMNKTAEMQDLLDQTRAEAGKDFGKNIEALNDLSLPQKMPLIQSENMVKNAILKAQEEVAKNPLEYSAATKKTLQIMENKMLNPESNVYFSDRIKAMRDVKQLAQEELDVYKDTIMKSSVRQPDRHLMQNLENEVKFALHGKKDPNLPIDADENIVSSVLTAADKRYAEFMDKFKNLNKNLGGKDTAAKIKPENLQKLMSGTGTIARQQSANKAMEELLGQAEKFGITEPLLKLRFIRDQMKKVTEFNRISALSGETTGKSYWANMFPPFGNPRLYIDMKLALKDLDNVFAEIAKLNKSKLTQGGIENMANKIAQTYIARLQAGRAADNE